jgi:hypothetical protein
MGKGANFTRRVSGGTIFSSEPNDTVAKAGLLFLRDNRSKFFFHG